MNTLTMNMFATTNEDMPLFSHGAAQEAVKPASTVDPRLTDAINAINQRLATRGAEYRYVIEQPRKGSYQIKTQGARPWYYPPSYGQDAHRIGNALNVAASISQFEGRPDYLYQQSLKEK